MLSDLLQPIVPGLFLLPAQNKGRFPCSHCFVVRGEVDALIDAGCGERRLKEALSSWIPDRVVVSHSHPDHCSGLWMLQGVDLASPVQQKERFWRFSDQMPRFTEPGPIGEAWMEFAKGTIGMREVEPGTHFDDGAVFDFGRVKLTAIHTPGHVDDHYVFFEEKTGTAFTFDIDLTSFGPWYAHRESDIDAFLASIERVRALKPRIIVSSHKGIVTDDLEKRLRRYAAVVDRRDEQLLAMLDTPRTVDELAHESPFYGGRHYAAIVLHYWESNMIEKHLVRMRGQGRVAEEEGRWRRA